MARADPARAGLTIRCAIYTRKSSDEGLEQDFNSLDAQREACEAYIVSQRHAGWVTLADMYDDGGLSGVQQGAAELGQFVIHTLRSGGEDSPRHQAVPLQSTQREREHPL